MAGVHQLVLQSRRIILFTSSSMSVFMHGKDDNHGELTAPELQRKRAPSSRLPNAIASTTPASSSHRRSPSNRRRRRRRRRRRHCRRPPLPCSNSPSSATIWQPSHSVRLAVSSSDTDTTDSDTDTKSYTNTDPNTDNDTDTDTEPDTDTDTDADTQKKAHPHSRTHTQGLTWAFQPHWRE